MASPPCRLCMSLYAHCILPVLLCCCSRPHAAQVMAGRTVLDATLSENLCIMGLLPRSQCMLMLLVLLLLLGGIQVCHSLNTLCSSFPPELFLWLQEQERVGRQGGAAWCGTPECLETRVCLQWRGSVCACAPAVIGQTSDNQSTGHDPLVPYGVWGLLI